MGKEKFDIVMLFFLFRKKRGGFGGLGTNFCNICFCYWGGGVSCIKRKYKKTTEEMAS